MVVTGDRRRRHLDHGRLQRHTGARRWLVTAAEGTAARDVVVDAARVYVTGQGVTGAGTPGNGLLSDRGRL